MEFKIDTNETYTLISPLSERLDANLSAALKDKCTDMAEGDSQNFIIDLSSVKETENAAFEHLLALHEECYENDRSLVFTGVVDGLRQQMKQEQVHLTLNITPTLQEAIDIVNMEVLERDLFNEDSNPL